MIVLVQLFVAFFAVSRQSLRPGESKNEGRWARRVTRVHCIQLCPVYTFRFTRGWSGSDNLMTHRSKTAQRGWKSRAVVSAFFSTWSQLHIDCIQRQTGGYRSITISIVSAYPVKYSLLNISSYRKGHSGNRVRCIRYLWRKSKTRKQSFTIYIANCIS